MRAFTAGLQADDVRRLFSRDARRADRALTREHVRAPQPAGGSARALYRATILFLGLSFPLSPARRVLFVCAIGAALLVLAHSDVNAKIGRASCRFAALWFLASVAMMIVLTCPCTGRPRARAQRVGDRPPVAGGPLAGHANAVPSYPFAHDSCTANEVGGGYCDDLRLPNGRPALVSGDAGGPGMAAGLLMAAANTGVQRTVETDPSPAGSPTCSTGRCGVPATSGRS